MACHILYGIAKPAQLLELAKSLNIPTQSVFASTIEKPIYTLRSSCSDIDQKIAAIESLHGILSIEKFGRQMIWDQVENVLYHLVFCWPLLLHNGRNPFSLPLAIDVVFNEVEAKKLGAEPPNEPIIRRVEEYNDWIDVYQWENSLLTAIRAAKVLWRGKHGNYWWFRDAVKNARIVFDLRFMQFIVRGFPFTATLSKRSMEAYLSQAIMNRLLGGNGYISSVVTGSIGECREDELDYEFNWPKGVLNKLKYVFGNQFFERMVVPDINEQDENYPERKELEEFLTNKSQFQSVEINYAKHLQHVADCVQNTGWRQHKYVRCPDVAWAIHSSDRQLPPPDTEEVQQCLALLRDNGSPILELRGIRATTLAGALWHINTELREKIPPIKRRPPMVSWAFVRAIPEEQDLRFWYVIWQLIGAPMEDFISFQNSPTPQDAAQCFIQAMNMFSPTENFPSYRAPDILVILNPECLSESLYTTQNPYFRILAFDRILKWVSYSGQLLPILDRYDQNSLMQWFLGKTRIVVLRETMDVDVAKHAIVAIESEIERTVLDCLSIFRFGFTQQMAGILLLELGYKGRAIRDILNDLEQRGYLNYTIRGEFYIPGHIGWPVEQTSAAIRAKRHYAAALALAPYLSSSIELSSLSFDRSFLPEFIHEAEYHLVEGLKGEYEHKDTDPADMNKIKDAFNNLMRFTDVQDWHTVKSLTNHCPKHSYELAVDLLEAQKASGYTPHPQCFVMTAKAAEKWWNSRRNDRYHNNPQEIQVLRGKILNLYEQAEKACEAFPTERDINYLFVKTRYAIFLHNFYITEEEKAHEKKLNEEAWKLLESGVNGSVAIGEWYEMLGDEEDDPVKKEEKYREGVRWIRDYTPLWIKLLGASFNVYGNLKHIQPYLDDLSIKEAIKILNRAERKLKTNYREYSKPIIKNGILEMKKYFLPAFP
jgi:hypothetical protein